jgi:hypothetical protein
MAIQPFFHPAIQAVFEQSFFSSCCTTHTVTPFTAPHPDRCRYAAISEGGNSVCVTDLQNIRQSATRIAWLHLSN